MQDQGHEELKSLVAAYAVGAVTPAESALVRSHLLSCEECLEEADLHAATGASLALVVEEEPLPQGFADRVMGLVAGDRPASSPAHGRARRVLAPLLAYAALVVIIAVLAIGFVRVRNREAVESRAVQAMLHDGGFALTGPGGAVARMVPSGNGGVFVASGLSDAPEGHTYQLWVVPSPCPTPSCTPRSAGTFEADQGVAVVTTERSLRGVGQVAVTIEPDGGSEEPTTQPVIRSG